MAVAATVFSSIYTYYKGGHSCATLAHLGAPAAAAAAGIKKKLRSNTINETSQLGCRRDREGKGMKGTRGAERQR